MAMTENDKIEKYGPLVSQVKSGDPKKADRDPYEIRTKDGVIHSCNCTAFVMDRKKAEDAGRIQTCKHIEFYLKKKGERDARLAQTCEVEKKMLSECFAAVGIVGIIRDAVGNVAYENKLHVMAMNLKGKITGTGKTAATTAAAEAAAAVSGSCGEDDLRVLVLED